MLIKQILFYLAIVKILTMCVLSMNNSITRVCATKFLGVIIDEKLTWKYHISLVRSKLAKTVGILYRVRHLLNRSALFINIVLFSVFTISNILC